MKKMNNKGFSLVELIVVVLIMAIIAVALAPQVMKWVDNSRRSTDEDNYNEMIANAQVALTDKDAYTEVYSTSTPALKYKFVITTSGTSLKDASGNAVTSGNFLSSMTKVSANWTSIKKKVSDTTPSQYEIDVYTDGSVRKVASYMPTLNSDLS